MRWLRFGLSGLAVLAALACIWFAVQSNLPPAPELLPLAAPAQRTAAVPQRLPSTENPDALNLNTATLEQLMTLPGIGEKLAMAILEAREVAPFHYVEDLRTVPGIGDRRLQSLMPLVRAGEEAFEVPAP